jgi:hypothetical protein
MLKTAMAELIEALKANHARELLSQDYEEQVGMPVIDPIPVGSDDTNE